LQKIWQDGFSQAMSLGAGAMAFEELKAQISLLINQINNQPEDAHELYETLHQRLNELRATGMPLPDDLAKLERELQENFPSAAARRVRPPSS
jgi:hypothetical protein